MRVELITVWYNEAFLAPFFLNHYAWVDKIHILLDADTDDETEAVATRYPNVSLERFAFPDMMDDLIKSRKINEKYRSISNADYVIVVDSDEFIACHTINGSIKKHLEVTGKNLYFSVLWQTYQHRDDTCLDATLPTLLQRRHGDPEIASANIKPTIAKGGLDLVWGIGNHAVVLNGTHMSWLTPNCSAMQASNVSTTPTDILQGAHWRLFDLDQVITRRTRNRSNRQSQVNLSANLSSHLHQATATGIKVEFRQMQNCPVVVKDRIPSTAYLSEHRSIFEVLLADRAFTDELDVNCIPVSVTSLYENSNVPDWYTSVRPLTPQEAMADEMFLLACMYRKQGQQAKASALLQKAQLLAPNCEHYRFYLHQWQTHQQEPL